MHKVGHDITTKELREIMKKHDSKRDGYISYDEFKEMITDLNN